ncbi:MAG TPA: type II toxin-antitoxin system RelE/ParE family toxin [Thermodesulfobacteriota bacterium]|nr:type II toxin-antitoxin system RelE/ParE family toxin [Thermodesulfobacteriota bacterium]
MKRHDLKLRVPDEIAALIRGMHPHLKTKVKASLKLIMSNPDEGKILRDELSGLRSFRVGRSRIIYAVKKKMIEIVAIGPRERTYEETYLILKKGRK